MINSEEFREYAHRFVDWMTDYFENIESYPVESSVHPGDVIGQLLLSPPEEGESIEEIFNDFKNLILPGISHWQSPGWMAYFPANTSYPSVLAEMLTATLGAQCMLWETSPAAAELEERMMEWLKSAMSLPEHFTGVIQDTASTATLCALLSAREKATGFSINRNGFDPRHKFRIYASGASHSSVEKAVRIAGFGQENLVKIQVDEKQSMRSDILEIAIVKDAEKGFIPLAVVATLGTTGTMAMDPLKDIAVICQKHKLWLHVDAAFAGSAAVLPEYRWIFEGLGGADSYVFNPHKWLFTNFDLSAYYVRDKEALIRTFSILPEYLKTDFDSQVNNYRDWGIPLGRRFRALKLWFVLRNFGLDRIRQILRKHIRNIHELAEKMKQDPMVEFLAPVRLNMICFRFRPDRYTEKNLNDLNQHILHRVNASGLIYLTHTKIEGRYTIRIISGQTYTENKHLETAWGLLKQAALNETRHD